MNDSNLMHEHMLMALGLVTGRRRSIAKCAALLSVYFVVGQIYLFILWSGKKP